jgi:hypothetical protein
MDSQLSVLTNFIRVSMALIQAKIISIIAIIMTFVLFGYVVWQPNYIGLGAVTVWSVLVLQPILKINQEVKNENI